MRRHPMIPVAPPYMVRDFYSPEQVDAMFSVLQNKGPWPLVSAVLFKSTEEFLAVAGGKDRSTDAKLTDYTAPSFRGYFARGGICLHPELFDTFYNQKALELAKKMHGAEYGLAHGMQFNFCGPTHSYDAGHFDPALWRGLTMSSESSPQWLQAIMAKSGLFEEYKVKTAQVITYFYEQGIDGGFTYWPDGPDRAPQRFIPPFHNDALVTDNSQMYHRREANGPKDQRDCPELDITTVIQYAGDGVWSLTNDGREIGRFTDAERRVLFHWTALVFQDLAEVKEYLDHTNDLTVDKALNMLIADLRARGVSFTESSDPVRDPEFIELLSLTYEMSPDEYPAEAPLDARKNTDAHL